MPKILIKHISTPDTRFTLSNLDLREIGINTTDGRLFLRKGSGVSSDVIQEIGNVLNQLGYTPLNKNGDVMTGPLTLTSGTLTSPPLIFKAGVTMPTPVPHSFEWDGAFLYVTNNGGQRKTIGFQDSPITGTSSGWTTARAITFTGDATGSFMLNGTVNVTTALTLPLVNNTSGTYGSGRTIPTITVNSKGLITNVVTAPISLTTTDIAEGTNLYYYDSRVRAAISVSGDLAYNATTGVISYTTPTPSQVGISGEYADLLHRPVFTSIINVTGTADKIIDAMSSNDFRAAKFVICVIDDATADLHICELLLGHNNTDSFMNEYGLVLSGGELGTFSSSLTDTGLMNLIFTPSTPTSKTVSITRTIALRG